MSGSTFIKSPKRLNDMVFYHDPCKIRFDIDQGEKKIEKHVMEQSSDQIMELTGDKLRELTNAIEDEEDDDDVCFFFLKPLNKSESDVRR